MKPETVPTIEARTLLHRWSEPRVTGHGFVWVCTDCERFAGPMPPPRDQLCDVRLLAEVDRLTAERAEARDNAEAAEELAREADTERKTVEAELAALRIEHEAVCGLLTHTRKDRDEARQYIPAAQSCHRLSDYMSTNRDLLEYNGCDMAGDGAIGVLGRLARERDELRAALLNEHGEGDPPSEGWARNDFDSRAVGIAWYRPSNADGSLPPAGAMDYTYALWVYREPTEPEWTWECEHADFSSRDIQGKAPTAREAMRAADTALAGGKS